jgi:hypothetical protein
MPAQFEPRLEFAFTVKITLERAYWVRPPDIGAVRAGIYLKDGTFEGPHIRGIVIPGSGADWPLVRPNGVIDFDARYMLQVDDGTVIYLQNRGFRWGPQAVMDAMARNEPVDHSSYYFRTSPKFEAPEGPHAWVNNHIFIGVGEKVPRGNQIHYYKLL